MMSIDDFSVMLATKNINMVCKVKMPNSLAKIAHSKLMSQYNNLFNKEELQSILESDSIKMQLYIQSANYLATLKTGVELYVKYKNTIKKEDAKCICNEFKNLFGHEPTKMADLKFIDNKIRKANSRLKNISFDEASKQAESRGNESTFEDVIFFVETVLKKTISRDISIFAFYTQYKNAKEQLQKQQLNNN